MPTACSLRRVAFVWLLRAWARRLCAYWISSAACSYRRLQARPDCHQLRTTATTAVWTWQTVNSGFFPPKFLVYSRQKEVTHGREDKVPFQPQIATSFIMVQTHLSLVIFKTPLNTRAVKSHQQELLDRSFHRRVAYKILDLGPIQDIARHNQVIRPSGQAVFPFGINQHVFDFPDHGAFFAVLDAISFPRLIAQRSRPSHHRFHRDGLGTARYDSGCPPTLATSVRTNTMEGPFRHARRPRPRREILAYLADKKLAPRIQSSQKRWSTVPSIEGQPSEPNAVRPSPVIQFQSDVQLGTVNHRVGNAGLTATLTIIRPRLRQEQFPVQQAMKIVHRQTQVYGNDAVVFLSFSTAILHLHARCFGSLLGIARVIDDADGPRTGMLLGHDLLVPLSRQVFIPTMLAKKFLQRPHGHVGLQRNRLDALTLQVGQLPFDVNRQVLPRIASRETVVKPGQKLGQLWFQLANLLSIHDRALLGSPRDSLKSPIYARSNMA